MMQKNSVVSRRLVDFIEMAVLIAVAIVLLTHPAFGADAEWQILKPSNTGVPGERVRFAKFGPEGKMWVSAYWPFWHEGGVGIFDPVTRQWENIANWETPLPSEIVTDIEFGADGVVWFATTRGLARKDGESWTVFNASNSPLLHNVIRSIDLDSDGHVWINNSSNQTTLAAVFEYDGQNWRSFSVPGDLPWPDPWRELTGLLVDSNDHVWISNSLLGGVAEYDGQTWTMREEGLPPVPQMVEDHAGNIWLAGSTLHQYDGKNFIPHDVVGPATSLTVGDDGKLWVGSYSVVIVTADSGQNWSLFAMAPIFISSIAPQRGSDDVWLTSIGAVRHHDGNGNWVEALNTYNSGVPDYFIGSIGRGAAGNMLLTSGEAGASRFDGTEWFNMGSHNPSAPWPVMADGADSAFYDSRGNFWVGSNGIMRWDGAEATYWHIILYFRGGFGEDINGTIWAAGGASLYRLENENWVLHSITSILREIESDSAGNMWVAGQAELRRWDGNVWTTWNAANTPNWSWSVINALAIGPGDVVWLGTDKGLVRFDGTTNRLYGTTNSPLPAEAVQGVDVRPDGVIGLTCHEFGPITPFPNGVVVIDGDINDSNSWTIETYENSPLPHYQLGGAAFDTRGRLWVSAISEGVGVLTTSLLANGDGDADGDVDAVDFSTFLDCVTGPAGGSTPACGVFDFDRDDDVDWQDWGAFQRAFTG